jgi:GcrA cell cycle regulator
MKAVAQRAWTELSPAEKEAAVEPLWRDGKSAAQIAARLGATSRNSIITVCVRLRTRSGQPALSRAEIAARSAVARRASTAKEPSAERKSPKAPKSERPKQNLRAANIAGKKESRQFDPPLIIDRSRAFDPLPGIEPVPFGSPSCKWSVDGTHGHGLLWCGAPRVDGCSYCSHHRRMAAPAAGYIAEAA